MRNSYNLLKVKLFFTVLGKGKISFRKILNVADSFFAYLVKRKKSSQSPFILSLELGNECNIACLFCRNESGVIHNLNSKEPEKGIAKGKMPLAMACDIIEQVKDRVLIAVLYTNGEPLLYHDLGKVIRYATDRKVATMIATNGLLFNDRIAKEILEADIDLIKIQLSGFTNDIYRIQTRFGDVEKLKANIRRLVALKNEGKHKAVILIDFISYNYNRHQVKDVQEFCNELGLMMNLRPGNPKGGLETSEKALHTDSLPLQESCAWVWQGMQVNWNGDVLPCCEAVVWADAPVYARYEVGTTQVLDVWNSARAQGMRRALSKDTGRGTIDMCSKCLRRGICFKW